jgi:hypothetical protein
LWGDGAAAYLKNTVLRRYVDESKSSFFTAAFDMHGNSSFRPDQKLIRGTLVYVSLKALFVEVSVNSSYCFVNSPCSVTGNLNWIRNH